MVGKDLEFAAGVGHLEDVEEEPECPAFERGVSQRWFCRDLFKVQNLGFGFWC